MQVPRHPRLTGMVSRTSVFNHILKCLNYLFSYLIIHSMLEQLVSDISFLAAHKIKVHLKIHGFERQCITAASQVPERSWALYTGYPQSFTPLVFTFAGEGTEARFSEADCHPLQIFPNTEEHEAIQTLRGRGQEGVCAGSRPRSQPRKEGRVHTGAQFNPHFRV